MKYYAILIDRNGFTKEVKIPELVPYVHVAISNPGTSRVFRDSEDFMLNAQLPSYSQKTFYLKDTNDAYHTKNICWAIYEEY